MNKALAFMLPLLTCCSDAPDPVHAAGQPESSAPAAVKPAAPVGQSELVDGPGMPKFLKPLEYDSPVPLEFRAPENWSEGIAEVSAGVVALLAGLDQAKLATLNGEGLDLRQLSRLYWVSGPRNTLLYLYLQRLYIHDAGCIVVFLEDRASGIITEEPIRYCSNRVAYASPRPSLIDLDGDGIQEIVTQDFFHNGTVLNLTIDAYWEVEPDLSLRQVLELARRDEGIRVEGEGFGTVTRRLMHAPERNGTNSFLLEVAWKPEGESERAILGGVPLGYDSSSGSWSSGPALFDTLSTDLLVELSAMGHRAGQF